MGNVHSKRGGSPLPESLQNGIKFRCTDCGACCTGAPGKVRVSEDEIGTIAAFRNQSVSEFREQEIRVVDGESLLTEKPNGDCVFFIENRCVIHSVKPRQCRTYPFWFQNVRNERAWKKTCTDCPGIGEGPWWSPEQIEDLIFEELNG